MPLAGHKTRVAGRPGQPQAMAAASFLPIFQAGRPEKSFAKIAALSGVFLPLYPFWCNPKLDNLILYSVNPL